MLTPFVFVIPCKRREVSSGASELKCLLLRSRLGAPHSVGGYTGERRFQYADVRPFLGLIHMNQVLTCLIYVLSLELCDTVYAVQL